MTTEYDLTCTTCGGSLAQTTVTAGALDVRTSTDTLAVAECVDCGSRYFPRTTLERL